MSKIQVLFISNDDRLLGGASLSLYNMIHSLRDDVYPIILLAERGEVYDFFITRGIECIVFPFLQLYYTPNGKNPIIRFLRYAKHFVDFEKIEYECAAHVCNLLKDRDIKIIHSNSSIMTVGGKIAKRLKAKHVWHVREFLDLDFDITPFRGRHHLERIIHSADAAIAITTPVYRHWRLQNMSNSYIIWNAVKTKADIILEEIKEKYFLFCSAQLSDNKGADFAVNCFSKSGLAEKGYKLKMVGRCSEEYKSKLINIAQSAGSEKQIDFVGYQTNLKPIMSFAAAFLMTSLNEGMGRTTIEAMFYGCPVIARHTGGTVDFMKHEETGFFFNSEDECVTIMNEMAANTPLHVIKNAQQLVIDNFSEEAYRGKIVSVYNNLLK